MFRAAGRCWHQHCDTPALSSFILSAGFGFGDGIQGRSTHSLSLTPPILIAVGKVCAARHVQDAWLAPAVTIYDIERQLKGVHVSEIYSAGGAWRLACRSTAVALGGVHHPADLRAVTKP